MKTQFQLTPRACTCVHMRCSLIAGSSRVLLSPLLRSLFWLPSQRLPSALTLLPGALTCPKSHPGAFSWNMLYFLPCTVPILRQRPTLGEAVHTQQNAFTSILVLVTSSFLFISNNDRSWSFLSAFSWSPLRYADYFISCGFHLFFFFPSTFFRFSLLLLYLF